MKKAFSLVAMLVLAHLAGAGEAWSQQTGVVTGGVVAAESRRPLPSVSVTVRAVADSSVVAGELSTPTGRFRLASVRPGRYVVVATLLGREPYRSEPITVTAGGTVDVGTIELATAAIALEGVQVTGERSAVVVAPDRTMYSTRDMPVASGGIATDVLRSVPELEVDIEGAVSLRGTAAQIYLNGRPAPMEGEALQVFLQQFPADRIERVEVIANPGSRFEAEGSGGIVNIVLKKNVDLGMSGSLFLNGSTRGEAGTGGRLAYQRGALTLFGGGFLRVSDRTSTSFDERRNLLAEPVTELRQDASSESGGLFGNVDLTAELKLSERSMVWAEGRVFRSGNESDGVSTYTTTVVGGPFLSAYDRMTADESSRLRTDFTAGFRHAFDPDRHELEVEVEVERGGEDELEEVRRLLLSEQGDPLDEPLELTLDDVAERESGITVEADYTRPFGELGRIEAGYRGQLEDSDNDRVLEVFEQGPAGPSEVLQRGFAFRELFHSGYLTAARKFGSFSGQLGLRAELAKTELTLPGDGGTFDNDYFSIFPNANLAYEAGEGREIRASYSRRIRRPQPWVLNPIDQSSDPLNRRVGNPDIDPQYTHSFSLQTSLTETWGTLRVSPYFRHTAGDWAEIKRVDADGVSTVTWENLASIDTYGTSLTASIRPINGIGGFVSVDGAREVRDASNLAEDFSGSAMRWSARGNVSARVTPSLSMQAMMFFRPAREVPQGRISSSVMSHVGVRQQFLDGRATVNLMVRDPLDMWRSSFVTSDPTHVQTGRSRWSARSAVLSFSYSFGRPPRDARNQQEGEEAVEEATIR